MTIWSGFGKKWAMLPGAAGGLNSLGVSAFIQTLLDDTDAATARTTLGSVGLTGNETVAGVKTFSSNPILSGGGIEFPATQVPAGGANVLDDYEEGTFTPAFSATGATYSYSSQLGRYIKVGSQVYFGLSIILNTSGNTLGTAALSLTGLPFSIVTNLGVRFPVFFSNATTSMIDVWAVSGGNTTLTFVHSTAAAVSNGGNTTNSNNLLHATNGSNVRIRGVYEA